MIDIQMYYGQIARGEKPSESEMVAVLKELAHFRNAAAYLASCEAATLEGLPKSASKSSRERHVAICLTAAKLLDEDDSDIRYKTLVDVAKDRCISAASSVFPTKNSG